LSYLAPAPFGADARSLIVRDVRTRLGGINASVGLRWIPQTMRITFAGRASTLSDAAREQLETLTRSLTEYPELVATVHGPDATELSAARVSAAAAVLHDGGIPTDRIRTLTTESPDTDAGVVSITVVREPAGPPGPPQN
jgi:hypothetical protein